MLENIFTPGISMATLIAVRPGLAIYGLDHRPITKEMYELFRLNDWELVPAAEPTHYYTKGVNGVIICGGRIRRAKRNLDEHLSHWDPNTICVEAHELKYIDQLTKLGFEVVPIPYDMVMPFGGELHCTTLDVYREGTLEDYFPKQVPGY